MWVSCVQRDECNVCAVFRGSRSLYTPKKKYSPRKLLSADCLLHSSVPVVLSLTSPPLGKLCRLSDDQSGYHGTTNTEDYLPCVFNHSKRSLSGVISVTSPILTFGGSFQSAPSCLSSALPPWSIPVQWLSLLFLLPSKSCFSLGSERCKPWLPRAAKSRRLAGADHLPL